MAWPDPLHNFRRDVSDAPRANIIQFPAAGLPPGDRVSDLLSELLMIGQVERLLLSTEKRRQKKEMFVWENVPCA